MKKKKSKKTGIHRPGRRHIGDHRLIMNSLPQYFVLANQTKKKQPRSQGPLSCVKKKSLRSRNGGSVPVGRKKKVEKGEAETKASRRGNTRKNNH